MVAKRRVNMSPEAVAKRRETGRLKVDRGRALEDFLTASAYALRGRVDYEHRPNPLRILRPNPANASEFICAKTKASGVDFDGVLSNGKAVYFDAKSSDDGSAFPIALISEHQREYLARKARFGAVCFVYVRATGLKTGPADFILPIGKGGTIAGHTPHHPLLEPEGSKRLRWLDLGPYVVGPGETWLDAAERIAGVVEWR